MATTRTTPLALALAALLLAPLAAHALQPTALRTEFLENPLGLDTAKPRFSWLVEDSAQNAKELHPNNRALRERPALQRS